MIDCQILGEYFIYQSAMTDRGLAMVRKMFEPYLSEEELTQEIVDILRSIYF